MKRYAMELTEDQLRTMSVACELYARVRMGQFREIVDRCIEWKGDLNEMCDRSETALTLLYDARQFIYPELNGRGHHYGVGKFEDADRAFDIHQVARHALGDQRTPWSEHDLPTIKELHSTMGGKV